jgi:hypothetical protein
MSDDSARNVGGVPSPRGDRVKLRGEGTPPTDDESPGVPGFRSWRGVYFFVFGCFVAMVIALTVFTRFYA